MRVLILHFLDKKNDKDIAILNNLKFATTQKGFQVTVVDAKEIETLRFSMYEYIAIVTKPTKLIGAKLPEQLKNVLAQYGNLVGVKGCSLVVKRGFSSEKMSSKVMVAMEKQGMQIDYFEIIEDAEHAKLVGEKIG